MKVKKLIYTAHEALVRFEEFQKISWRVPFVWRNFEVKNWTCTRRHHLLGRRLCTGWQGANTWHTVGPRETSWPWIPRFHVAELINVFKQIQVRFFLCPKPNHVQNLVSKSKKSSSKCYTCRQRVYSSFLLEVFLNSVHEKSVQCYCLKDDGYTLSSSVCLHFNFIAVIQYLNLYGKKYKKYPKLKYWRRNSTQAGVGWDSTWGLDKVREDFLEVAAAGSGGPPGRTDDSIMQY